MQQHVASDVVRHEISSPSHEIQTHLVARDTFKMHLQPDVNGDVWSTVIGSHKMLLNILVLDCSECALVLQI